MQKERFIDVFFKEHYFSDFYLVNVGYERCSSGHRFGPNLREHYILHYVTKGRGSYTVGNCTYSLEKGDFFLIRPNELIDYQANDDFKPLLDGDEELWDKIFSINVKGPFLLTQAVLPTMIDKGKGNIINIASIAGKMAGGGGAACTSTKHAMNGFTKQLSYDYGQKGIRVNAIAPGYIRTAMTEGVDESMVEDTPAGHPGEANEIAKLSLFLASDDSDYIHGETITIDGGLTIGI